MDMQTKDGPKPVVYVARNMSEETNELFAALAKAQGAMEGAKKDSANPFFKSKYADLSACWETIRKPFSENGLSVIQPPEPTDGTTVRLKTILGHSSGQWISSVVVMTPAKTDPQGIGSCLTYARRYGLMAMTGIAPEDDDGEGTKVQAQPRGERTITQKQQKFLFVMAKQAGFDEAGLQSFLKTFGVEKTADIKAGQFDEVLKAVKGASVVDESSDVPM